MTSLSPIGSRFIAEMSQLNLTEKPLSLDSIRNARGDINEIRILLKGNENACLNLFKKAVDEGDVISQIQLSYAFYGMHWGKDGSKDFSFLTAIDLKTFYYCPEDFELFNSVYDEAMNVEYNYETHEMRGKETFRLAADRGYLPAVLELKCDEWKSNTFSYGFAVQLRPFVGKGDCILDYHFGLALKNGTVRGSNLYYEGLYWMNRSGFIQIKYPRNQESFECFVNGYFNEHMDSHYSQDGFHHVGNYVILAPSEEVWMNYVRNKLAHVSITPMEWYCFEYDANQIRDLLNEYKIHVDWGRIFIESSTEGEDFETRRGIVHGFWTYFVNIWVNHSSIGKIHVHVDTLEVYQTIENPILHPVFKFIENVMIRSGSGESVYWWLRQLGGEYI